MDNNRIQDSQNKCSTLEICEVSDFARFTDLWPRILEQVDKNTKISDLLGVLLGCMGSGLLLSVELEGNLIGFCAVGIAEDDTAVVQSLPCGEPGAICMEAVHKWARACGVKELRLLSHKLNGSNFRYIEKTLGFRRKAMIFSQPVRQDG